MGRESSKPRRDKPRIVAGYQFDAARALADYVEPTKEQLREEARDAVRRYFADSGRITKLPTILNLQCPKCRHRGSARLPPGRTMPRFRCKRCGSRI